MAEELSKGERFINAYNKIDKTLRNQYNLKHGLAFSDIIRRLASINAIIRKFEDLLIDFSRLRNAIIHESNDVNEIIAEPRENIVAQIENIAKLIEMPPLALNTACRKDLLIVQKDISLKEVIGKISKSGYSNIPIYDDENFVGVANGQKLIDLIGVQINIGNTNIDKYLEQTKIGDVISENQNEKYYVIANYKLTIDEALNMFYINRKLLAIVITKTGNLKEPALGIITVADIIDMNATLDNYK